jgi:Transcriptional regulator PadR-like family
MSKPSDLVQGMLNLLIMKILILQPLHGWAISQRLKQVSSDVLQVSDGSLYPALHKLEQEGWIAAEWKNQRARSARQVLFAWRGSHTRGFCAALSTLWKLDDGRSAHTTPARPGLARYSRRRAPVGSRALTLFNTGTLKNQLALPFFPVRVAVSVLGTFGLIAVVLSATGVFALVAYAVSRRTREIGIRIAMGAGCGQVLRAVLARTLALAL